MISAVVAEQLRARDFDVETAGERRELRGLADDDLFAYAQVTQRALVTYNHDDFLELDHRFRRQNRRHHGIVILNPSRFPQGSVSVGPLVSSLDQLIVAGAPYESFIHWLQ
jgi:hypothetical protein